MHINSSIENIKGIGENRKKILNRLSIYSIEDLLSYYPREYEDRTKVVNISDIKIGEKNTIKGIICTMPQNINKKGFILTKVKLKDKSGFIYAVWFGQSYLKKTFKLGEEYYFTGKIIFKYGQVQIQSPDFVKADTNMINSILPIYSLTSNMSQKVIRKLVLTVINQTCNQLKEFIPKYIRIKYNLSEYNFAIQQIHYPDSYDTLCLAKRRLVFEEFFILQVGLLQIKNILKDKSNGLIIKPVKDEKDFIESLSFNLTNAQKKVWNEIKQDLKSSNCMNRLVQGDVGSGKTILAILAILTTVKNGCQTAMMVPTEVLAKQHYKTAISLLNRFGITCELLVGSLTKKTKMNLVEKIKEGSIDVVIGTHAIIQDNIIFKNLGLVITDEQHRFGVRQRTALSKKSESTNILVMTATPIPRTLALILYGDLDISIIDEMPPGRQIIKTYCVGSSYHQRVYDFLKEEIKKDRQAYIICPMVEENDKNDLKSVIDYTDFLKEKVFNDYEIKYLHGKMKAKEKNEIMGKFSEGEVDILVSTTVIEVGVNVPNASLIIIENAERFGLAQLHQLRGRVGRGKYQSYCILITDSKNKLTKKRMKIMMETDNGFKISEVDLNLRGQGDVFGLKQHGLPNFKLANIYEDMDLLKQAQEASKYIIEQDPFLKFDENKELKKKINCYFEKTNKIISL